MRSWRDRDGKRDVDGKSAVYSIQELSWEDVETFIEKTTEKEELKEKILQQSEKIARDLRYDILFLMNNALRCLTTM